MRAALSRASALAAALAAVISARIRTAVVATLDHPRFADPDVLLQEPHSSESVTVPALTPVQFEATGATLERECDCFCSDTLGALKQHFALMSGSSHRLRVSTYTLRVGHQVFFLLDEGAWALSSRDLYFPTLRLHTTVYRTTTRAPGFVPGGQPLTRRRLARPLVASCPGTTIRIAGVCADAATELGKGAEGSASQALLVRLCLLPTGATERGERPRTDQARCERGDSRDANALSAWSHHMQARILKVDAIS